MVLLPFIGIRTFLGIHFVADLETIFAVKIPSFASFEILV